MTKLVQRRFPSLGKSATIVADVFSKDFRSMLGNTLKYKLRMHYINFRNRFHFGNVTVSKANIFNVTPFMQLSFLDAAEVLRGSNGDLRRIFYDVFSALDERLPFFPFDKNSKEFETRVLKLGATWKKSQTLRKISRVEGSYDPVSIETGDPAARFKGQAKSILLEKELARATGVIRDSGIYKGIDFEGYLADVQAARKRNVDAYIQYRSSLISTAHLLGYVA